FAPAPRRVASFIARVRSACHVSHPRISSRRQNRPGSCINIQRSGLLQSFTGSSWCSIDQRSTLHQRARTRSEQPQIRQNLRACRKSRREFPNENGGSKRNEGIGRFYRANWFLSAQRRALSRSGGSRSLSPLNSAGCLLSNFLWKSMLHCKLDSLS